MALIALATLAACSGPARAHRSTTTTKPHNRHGSAAPTTSTTIARSSTPPSGSAMPAGFQPGSVSFVSSSTGFVIGVDSSCAVARCVAVARTTNGGSSWVALNAPTAGYAAHGVRTTTAVPAVSEVRFANEIDGWIWGPALFATHDGGAVWQPVNLGGSVVSLEVSGGWVYAVVSPCLEAQGCSAQLQLERAPATGGAFETLIRGAALTSYGGNALELSLQSPAGYADLSPADTAGANLYAATDLSDPRSWKPFSDPCAVVARSFLVSFVAPDTTNLYSLCSGQGAAGSESKAVVKTASGKSTVAGRPPSGGDTEALAVSPSGTMVVAAASGASYLYRSTDGGRTWATAATYDDGGVGFNDLGFTTTTQGVVVHGLPGSASPATQLLVTRNGGASWQAVSFG